MVLVRDVFQAKYGRGDELVALLKEARDKWPQPYASRILTDLSGQFFTVVAEMEVPSLAEWERSMSEEFAAPEFGDWFSRMVPLVDSGRREYYTVE